MFITKKGSSAPFRSSDWDQLSFMGYNNFGAVTVSQDGSKVVVCTDNGRILYYEVETGTHSLATHLGGYFFKYLLNKIKKSVEEIRIL